MACDVRWLVSFTPDLTTARTLVFTDGEIQLRHDALRMVLIDERGVTVDARFLRVREWIDVGQAVSFPCHIARVRDRIPVGQAVPPHQTCDGKVGGDCRSFAEVVASEPSDPVEMEDRGGHFFRGNRREGFGAGRFGCGAGRFDQGHGRGRFSWSREADGDDLSTNKEVASGSDDTTRWDDAADRAKRARSRGVWVEKQPNPNPHDLVIDNNRKKQTPDVIQRDESSNQAKDQGFFYIPDSCTAKQLKERSTSVVITVIEGEASVKELEDAFSDYIGTKWHCTARPIGPNSYVMHFPNQRDVKKACYNDKMTLRSCSVVVKIIPWSANVGAKGVMEVAWVRVANIPLERGNERNLTYVSSLVGVPLEIDMATLHKPEYVRVWLGCRNVDELPGVVEAVLGTHFFDFFYDIEKVLGTGVNKGGTSGKDVPNDNAEEVLEDLEESEDNTLLIDSIAKEACEQADLGGSQALLVVDYNKQNADEIQVEEVTDDENIKGDMHVEYMVQFPVSSDDVEEVIPTTPLKSEDTLRFSTRNVQNMEDKIQDRAVAISKKRNLEAKMGVLIPDSNFSSIDILRELERARNNNSTSSSELKVPGEEKMMYITNGKGDKTPLSSDWADGEEDLEEDFVLVRSRKKRSPKIQVTISRPSTRSQNAESDEARGRGDAENWRRKAERECFSADEDLRDGLSGRRSSLRRG
ncbi:uncharacterized protein [Aegilops tauschii subsp. strangulata]|uniref:uncharacterized protein n=1 Tax=Aegilops tauschii subsp. strangulata TaxID=200361 RepID=UPI003CC84079